MDVVYLGVSGVLHPSATTYTDAFRRSPWDDGHSEYEGVHVLESALRRWPSAHVVLTSTQPWKHGLDAVLSRLGPAVGRRVVGFTFEDLTTKAERVFTTRSGTTRRYIRSGEDYWRMNKSDIVAAHVEWLRPERWIAIDDESILWSEDVYRDRLVLTDGCEGLLSPTAQDRLYTVLEMNFGPPAGVA
jgi:hypothetical protein